MKLQELNTNELLAINGGANGAATAIGLTISTDALLSLDYSWNNGNNQSYSANLTLGKDIQTGAGTSGNYAQK